MVAMMASRLLPLARFVGFLKLSRSFFLLFGLINRITFPFAVRRKR